MSKLRNLSQRFPIPFVILFILMNSFLLRGFGLLRRVLPDTLLSEALVEVVSILWPIAILLLFGYGFVLKQKGFGKTLKAGMPIFITFTVFLLISLFSHATEPATRWQSFPAILVGILSLAGVGIREEILDRGVVANSLAFKYGHSIKGLWLSVLLSGFLFGFSHMFNMFSGVSFTGALVQSAGAAGLGILLSAIYLRGGNIWAAALIHSIVDAHGLFVSTFTISTITEVDVVHDLNPVSALIQLPIILLLVAFLFRKAKRAKIFERLDALRTKLDLEA